MSDEKPWKIRSERLNMIIEEEEKKKVLKPFSTFAFNDLEGLFLLERSEKEKFIEKVKNNIKKDENTNSGVEEK
jgi:hypothetical protein